MSDQPNLLDVPPSSLPGLEKPPPERTIHPLTGEWFRAGSTTPFKHAASVGRGLHPFGLPLSTWPGATCGNCQHAVSRESRSRKVFHKCGLDRHLWTGGPGSDLRLKWRACHRWEPKPDPLDALDMQPGWPMARTIRAESPTAAHARVAFSRLEAVVEPGGDLDDAVALLLKGIRAALGKSRP